MDLSQTGDYGTGGTDGATPGASGTDAGAGGPISLTNNSTDASNTTEASGGEGGSGGSGASDSSGAGGDGGSGGIGGSASATTTASSAANASASATAHGGGGGGGGTAGSGTPSGRGGDGGDGGSGSSASANATSTGAGTATAGVSAGGGDGGSGVDGGNGGAGGSVSLTNAVGGSTAGGTLNLIQGASGGAGGSDRYGNHQGGGGTGGAGGDGASSLTFDDTANSNTSASLNGNVTARGGAGGGATHSGAGGTGAASLALSGAAAVRATSEGDGGSGGSGGSGGDGGAASSMVSAATTGTGSPEVDATANASGGAGGDANASGSQSGNGGSVTSVSARGTDIAGAATVNLTANGTGGKGGNGTNGASGGTGASVTLTDAVAGETAGGNLTLVQTATGGGGGDSSGGTTGAGGAATSSLTFDDTANATKSATVTTTTTATAGYGGTGSSGSAGASGGAAAIASTITGTGAITAQGDANGGTGGGADQAAAGSAGTASASSNVTSTGTGAFRVSAMPRAFAGSGGTASGSGFTGAAGATATASAQASTAGAGTSVAGVYAAGGAGGAGLNGASGGAGGAVMLTNAVSGSTNGGTLSLIQNAAGGNGGNGNGSGSSGSGGNASSSLTFDDTANTNTSAVLHGSITAGAGAGGSGTSGGTGGTSTGSLTLTGAATVAATATSNGGGGGTGGIGTDGPGAAGGAASSTVAAASTGTGGQEVDATANATGGAGGAAVGSTSNGGNGGAVASVSAEGTSAGAATVNVTANGTGGNGGASRGGTGGTGGAATLTNAVSGSSAGGSLLLSQQATGGGGGSSTGGAGGAGGAATSNLTFDDTSNSTQSGVVTYPISASSAYGGGGGSGSSASNGGSGGAAVASSAITGASSVHSRSYAQGGAGAGSGTGGAATATDSAHATSATSAASAAAGAGAGSAGMARATSTGTGATGSFDARAESQPGTGALIQDLFTDQHGALDGTTSTGTAYAQTSIATAASSFTTTYQSVGQVVGLPQASDVSTALSSNPNLNIAFSSASQDFALGEVGARYDASGASTETLTSTVQMTIDPTLLGTRQDLILGLYNATLVGSGFSSLTFDVDVAGTSGVVNQTFTSLAAAQTYFTDHPIDLGAIGTSAFNVHISFTETVNAANSGFYAGFVLGDAPAPPPTVTASAGQATVAATSAAGAVETFTASASDPVDGSDPVTFTEQLANGTTQTVHSGDTFSIGTHTIVASATDTGGKTGSTTFSFEVVNTTAPTVTASADQAKVTATSAAGAVETFTASASDPVDGSDPLTFTEQLANGTTQTVHSGDTFSIGTHTIVASATDTGGNTGSTTFSFEVVNTTAPTVMASIGGALSGSTVFADANGNGLLDSGEVSTTTDANGNFTLSGGSGDLVLTGGTDTATGQVFTGTLTAPAGSTVISPLTTILGIVEAQDSVSQADANTAIVATLGLPAGTDLTQLDAVASAAAGNTTGVLALAGQVQFANLEALAGALGADLSASPAPFFLANQYFYQGVGPTGVGAMTRLGTLAGLDAGAASIFGQIAAAANQLIVQAVETSGSPSQIVATIEAVAKVVQAQAVPAIESGFPPGGDPVAEGQALVNSYTGANLANAVNAAGGSVPVSTPSVVEYAGYVSGATVFNDANINFTPDPGEASTTSGNTGQFTLGAGTGEFQAQGGTDTSTGLTQPGLLVGPSGSHILSPLTAVIQVVSAVQGLNTAQANALVVADRGLPQGTDLTQLDALAGAKAGNAIATRVLADQVESGNLIGLVNAAGGSFTTQNAAFQDIGNETVQVTDSSNLTQLGSDAGLDSATAAAYGQIGAAASQLIEATVAAGYGATQTVATIEAIATVVEGQAASALHAAVGNQSALNNAVAAYTGNNLANAVNAAGGSVPVNPPSIVEYAGYVSGATVFNDANINFTPDPGEATTTSNGAGQFTLSAGTGEFQAQGGTDTATGLAQPGLLVGPSGSHILSPLTAVIQVVSVVQGLNTAQANAVVVADRGLPQGTDLTQLDALAGAKTGDAVATRVFADQVESGNLIALVNAGGGSVVTQNAGFQDVGNETIKVTDASNLTQYGSDAGLDSATATAYGQIGAAANQLIEATVAAGYTPARTVATIEAIAKVVEGNAASALHAAVGNQSALDNAVASYTGTNLANAVNAVVAQPPTVTASAGATNVQATSSAGAVETFTASASDLVDGTEPVTFTEQLAGGGTKTVHSGDTFAIGTHTIVASATDSRGLSGSASFSFTVTAAGQQGVAEDGYIAGATVFADANHDGVLDNGEVSTTTDANGNFTLTGGSGPLVLVGGTDITTGLPFSGKLQAPSGASIVSPLTTIVQIVAQTQGVSVTAANASVVASLGLGDGTDLTTLDAQSGATSGNATATSVFAAQSQVANAFSLIQAAGGNLGSPAANTAIATAFTSPSANVLTNSSSLANLATNAGVSAATASAVGNIASATNAIVAGAAASGASPTTIVSTIAAAATVAQGAASDALAQSASDPSMLQATTAAYTGSNLAQATINQGGDPAAVNTPPPSVPTLNDGTPVNGVTSDTTPTITGTADVGDTVSVYRDAGVLIGSTPVDPNGNYSIPETMSLTDGRHIFYALATDGAGNRSGVGVTYLTVQTTTLPPPSVPTLDDGTPSGGVTIDDTPTITGTADAGDTVSVYRDNGVLIGSTSADQNGNYTITPSSSLADGRHILYALATDGAGNRSAPSITYLTVQTTTLPPPSVPTLDDGTPSGGVTSDTTPTITGTADAGDTVSVYSDNGVLIGSTAADQNGNYSIAETTALADGRHILYALATDGAGNRSAPAVTYLTVAAATPTVPSTPTIDDGAPADGLTNNNAPTITGTADAGDTVAVFQDNAVLVGSAVADTGGTYTITPSSSLADGRHILYGYATDTSGNRSNVAATYLTVDTTPPVVTVDGDGTQVSSASQTITGTGEAGTSLTLSDNNAQVATTTVGGDGTWSQQVTLSAGANSFVATDTDLAGNVGTSQPATYTLSATTAASMNSMVQAMSTMTPSSSPAMTASAPSSTPETHLAASHG